MLELFHVCSSCLRCLGKVTEREGCDTLFEV